MKSLIVLLLAAFMVCSAQAQKKPAAPRWSKEPATVFGLKLGEPVSEDLVRECSPDPNQAPSAVSFCRTDKQLKENTPVCCFAGIYEFRGGMLFLEGGLAKTLLITARRIDYEAVRSLLIERYGSPTRAERNEVTSRGGAKFTSEELTWTGRNIEISLQERAGTMDQTAVQFTHLGTAAKSEAKRQERAKEDASKL